MFYNFKTRRYWSISVYLKELVVFELGDTYYIKLSVLFLIFLFNIHYVE